MEDKLDEIAEKYYVLVGWYEEQEPYEGQRFPWRDDCDAVQIAHTFYEYATRNPDKYYSNKMQEVHASQQKGLEYLKECVVEAMLSGEPYIREFATLIHKDMRKAEKERNRKQAEEFHKRKNK